MAEQPSQRTRWLRIVALVLLTGAAYLALRMTGALDRIDVPGVRAAVLEAGVWGVGLFALVFALGELIHVPGMIFVGAGILAYGPLWGFGVSLLAAIFSVCVSFVLVRAVGGQLLAEVVQTMIERSASAVIVKNFDEMFKHICFAPWGTNLRFQSHHHVHRTMREDCRENFRLLEHMKKVGNKKLLGW